MGQSPAGRILGGRSIGPAAASPSLIVLENAIEKASEQPTMGNVTLTNEIRLANGNKGVTQVEVQLRFGYSTDGKFQDVYIKLEEGDIRNRSSFATFANGELRLNLGEMGIAYDEDTCVKIGRFRAWGNEFPLQRLGYTLQKGDYVRTRATNKFKYAQIIDYEEFSYKIKAADGATSTTNEIRYSAGAHEFLRKHYGFDDDLLEDFAELLFYLHEDGIQLNGNAVVGPQVSFKTDYELGGRDLFSIRWHANIKKTCELQTKMQLGGTFNPSLVNPSDVTFNPSDVTQQVYPWANRIDFSNLICSKEVQLYEETLVNTNLVSRELGRWLGDKKYGAPSDGSAKGLWHFIVFLRHHLINEAERIERRNAPYREEEPSFDYTREEWVGGSNYTKETKCMFPFNIWARANCDAERGSACCCCLVCVGCFPCVLLGGVTWCLGKICMAVC